MDFISEQWNRFVNETTTPRPKAIFMAGSPGAGKSYVLKNLGINFPVINADDAYEQSLHNDPDLSPAGKPLVYKKKKENKLTF